MTDARSKYCARLYGLHQGRCSTRLLYNSNTTLQSLPLPRRSQVVTPFQHPDKILRVEILGLHGYGTVPYKMRIVTHNRTATGFGLPFGVAGMSFLYNILDTQANTTQSGKLTRITKHVPLGPGRVGIDIDGATRTRVVRGLAARSLYKARMNTDYLNIIQAQPQSTSARNQAEVVQTCCKW